MNRLGLDAPELDTLAADHGRLHGLDLRYVMTHLVRAECPDDPLNELQRRASPPPAPACRRRRARSPTPPGCSSAPASRPTWPGPAPRSTAINPTPGRPNPQRPVVRLRARVLQVRDVPAGDGVGYNAQWTRRPAEPHRHRLGRLRGRLSPRADQPRRGVF